MKAKFIVVEGLEGAGKTTAIQTVVDFLRESGVTSVTQTREPGGTPIAEKLRAIFKQEHDHETLQDMSELFLIYAARVQLVETVIKPSLLKGTWVIGDRHDLSAQAYQGGGRGIDRHVLTQLRQMALKNFSPDLTLYLDIDPKLGLERARGRGELDRIEKMDLGFFERTRECYMDFARHDQSIRTIDAGQSLQQVQADIRRVLNDWFSSL
ncbi:Thymidylate kinase [Vibrio aerogenes CECT 7868]|uniref:Thymidylate kinase n=1 Tax=Vibrio aerogenes CECT 7868 TaxID=1216006 RepID=A0A1M6D9L8_9VIBR|nr:dTMP kinase [Vibrio aerogenes]SHI69894.1 Thymidylate kinase [Vibrio aerogenes CECT 7868]